MRNWCLVDPQAPEPSLLPRLAWQREFAESDAQITLVAAGKGAGKSVGLLHFQDEHLFYNPGQAHIFTAPTEALTKYYVNSYFRPAFKNMITGESRGLDTIHLAGGRTFIYRTSGNLAAVEAYTCASGSSDELQMSDSLLMGKMWARLRGGKRPRLGFVCTPDSQWIKREFEGRDDKLRKCIHASVLQNPFLTEEWIEGLGESVPTQLAPAYLEGQFITPGSAVYAADVNDATILPDAIVQSGNWRYGIAVDPGFRMPHVLFVAVAPPGALHPTMNAMVVYDEIVGYDLTSEQLAHAAKERKLPIQFVVIDPAGDARDSRSGESDVIIMRSVLKCQFYFPHPNLRPIEVGVMRVKTGIKPYTGKPRIYFTESMKLRNDPRSCWNCLTNYSYPKDKEGKAVSNVPIKDGFNDHAMDALRYAAIRLLPDRPQAGSQALGGPIGVDHGIELHPRFDAGTVASPRPREHR